jgi:hypothetical protein
MKEASRVKTEIPEAMLLDRLRSVEVPSLSPVDVARCVSATQRMSLLGLGRVPLFTTVILVILGLTLGTVFTVYTGAATPETVEESQEWFFAMFLGYPLGLTGLLEQALWMLGLFLLGLGVTGSLICSALDVRTEVTK